MTETTKKGAGLAITGFVLGILALVFCWCPILNWILAILGVIFGLIGLFINRLKGLALIGVIAAVAAICIWKFYYVPKIQNAAAEADLTGSFSLANFIHGVFQAVQNHWNQEPNRILISKSN